MTGRPCACDRVLPGAWTPASCWRCWLYYHSEWHRRAMGGPGAAPPLPAYDPGPARPAVAAYAPAPAGSPTAHARRADARGPCLYLGRRVEFIPGCSGRRCRHECGDPNPATRAAHPVAVPGGNCQTCGEWVADA